MMSHPSRRRSSIHHEDFLNDQHDSLYIPSKQSALAMKNIEKKDKAAEYDYKTLLSQLGLKFSQDIIKQNPIIETILEDLEELNVGAKTKIDKK